jgi:hypothetical protein
MLSRGQRYAVAGGIAGAHVAVIYVLLVSGRLASAPGESPPFEVSLWEPRHVSPPAAPAQLPATESTATPSAAESARESEPLPITAPAEDFGLIDWSAAAQLAADDVVRDLVKDEDRHCDDSPRREPWLPPCRKHYGRFDWSAQPQRAGFENGIPYFRLGKSCVITLGMLGCSLGPPPVNGNLFADFRDPDRDRNSVPDVKDINEPVDEAPQLRSVVVRPDPLRPSFTFDTDSSRLAH